MHQKITISLQTLAGKSPDRSPICQIKVSPPPPPPPPNVGAGPPFPFVPGRKATKDPRAAERKRRKGLTALNGMGRQKRRAKKESHV